MAREILVFGQFKVRLFQRNDQPSNYWFMRTQIEGKPYKRSLKTAHLQTARDNASQEMIEVLAKMKAGLKVFSKSLKDAKDAYLLDQEERVIRDKRSKFTVKKIRHRIDRAFAFLKDKDMAPTTPIDTIPGAFWQGYIDWRLKPMPDIRRDGIHDELTSIRAWIEWVQGKGWCSASNIPKWELELEKQQATRTKIAPADFNRARQLMYDWTCAAADKNSLAQEKREMLFTVFMTISCGAFRTGEILQVRRKDIQVSDNEIIVTVQDGTSKVRKTRQVPLLHEGTVCLQSYLEARPKMKPDALVFSLRDAKNPSKMFYREFSALRKEVLIPAGLGHLDAYHGRHHCITTWLLAGHSIHLVAKLAGTSVSQIERTYSGVIELAIGREFAKHRLDYKEDGSFEVVKRKADRVIKNKRKNKK